VPQEGGNQIRFSQIENDARILRFCAHC
jgi:hypothetical protein